MKMEWNPKKRSLHFVGIGGIGMSGIAIVLKAEGYRVTGSDIAESDIVRKLRSMGIEVHIGHQEGNLHSNCDAVVISSAVRDTNPEVIAARRLRIPVIPRAEMLGEIMRGKIGIAVAGTHGKTTSTSMMGAVFSETGLDPTVVIGGVIDLWGSNALVGKGGYVIAEADESDGSFLQLPTTFVQVTNIDNDHLDHFGTIENVEAGFVSFINRIPFYGEATLCGDDERISSLLPMIKKPYQTYGFDEDCDYVSHHWEKDAEGSTFRVKSRKNGDLGQFQVHALGRHNVQNALGVIACSLSAGVPIETIRLGLKTFAGVKRRLEVRFVTSSGARVVEDYGHHPTEVRATLSALRDSIKGRLFVVFQPHRYSRTKQCMADFAQSFGQADDVLITDIYAASEDPIPGITGQTLVEAVSKQGHLKIGAAQVRSVNCKYVGSLEDAAKEASRFLSGANKGDVVLCLGAGSITKLPQMIQDISKK